MWSNLKRTHKDTHTYIMDKNVLTPATVIVIVNAILDMIVDALAGVTYLYT